MRHGRASHRALACAWRRRRMIQLPGVTCLRSIYVAEPVRSGERAAIYSCGCCHSVWMSHAQRMPTPDHARWDAPPTGDLHLVSSLRSHPCHVAAPRPPLRKLGKHRLGSGLQGAAKTTKKAFRSVASTNSSTSGIIGGGDSSFLSGRKFS